MPQIISSIHECARQAGVDNSILVALVSGGSAVLGAAVVSILNYFTARKAAILTHDLETKKMRVNLVTSERLRWLQDIRGRLSTLYAELDMQFDLLRRPVNLRTKAEMQSEMDAFSKKVMLETNNIIAMLNPAKPDQLKLRNALNAAMDIILATPNAEARIANLARYTEIKRDAFDALTDIGVAAWSKVQNLQ